jgi:hypothetical protein
MESQRIEIVAHSENQQKLYRKSSVPIEENRDRNIDMVDGTTVVAKSFTGPSCKSHTNGAIENVPVKRGCGKLYQMMSRPRNHGSESLSVMRMGNRLKSCLRNTGGLDTEF